MKPSIGHIVHYVSRGSADGVFKSRCRAAIVTEVARPTSEAEKTDTVGLAVFNPTGVFLHSLENGGCKHEEPDEHLESTGGTWHWPERVD